MLKADSATYVHAGHACYHCLEPQAGVDFEVHIEGEGILYLCRVCLGDAAKLAGIIDAPIDELLVTENKQLKAELTRERGRSRDARRRMRAAQASEVGLTTAAAGGASVVG